MALVGGGAAGGRVFADVAINNNSDRVHYLQKQVGGYLTWLPNAGLITDQRASFKSASIEADPNGGNDGETFGNQRLVSAAGLFRSDMVGKKVFIDGMERTVTIFTSSTEIEVSGDALPATTGRLFTVDGGILASERSMSSAGQILDGHLVQAAAGRIRLRWVLGEAP